MRTEWRMMNGEWRILLACALGAAPALAGVEFSISPEPYYVGSPITLAIDVTNEPNHEPPRLPQIDGTQVSELPPSRHSQISMGTGRNLDGFLQGGHDYSFDLFNCSRSCSFSTFNSAAIFWSSWTRF